MSTKKLGDLEELVNESILQALASGEIKTYQNRKQVIKEFWEKRLD